MNDESIAPGADLVCVQPRDDPRDYLLEIPQEPFYYCDTVFLGVVNLPKQLQGDTPLSFYGDTTPPCLFK